MAYKGGKPADPIPEGSMVMQDYARHANLSQTQVSLMIKKGDLLDCSHQDNLGRWIIQVEEADKILAMPSIHRQSALAKRDREKGQTAEKKAEEAAKNPMTYTDARTGNEFVKLHMAKIALEEKRGSLINKEQVVNETYVMARTLREQLMVIPDRLAAQFAAEKDERTIHKDLADEIRAALVKTTEIITAYEAKR